jgi:adenosine phosphosulfate reductase beta subunit
MPSYVIDEKCDGCKGQDRTACMYICPNDLMVLDAEAMKAYNQEPEFCWECFSCVKICPQQAIDVRGYVPDGGFPEGPGDLNDQNLWTEPQSGGLDKLPTK